MPGPNTASVEPVPLREVARKRHHDRARAVAEGRKPEGPQHIVDILLSDPAFKNLVSLYEKGLVP